MPWDSKSMEAAPRVDRMKNPAIIPFTVPASIADFGPRFPNGWSAGVGILVLGEVDDAPLVRGDYHYYQTGPCLRERVVGKLKLGDEAGVVVAQAQSKQHELPGQPHQAGGEPQERREAPETVMHGDVDCQHHYDEYGHVIGVVEGAADDDVLE